MSFILHMDVKRLLTLSVVLVSSAAILLVASAASMAAVENGKIAFGSKDTGGGGAGIFYMSSDGSGLTPLTNDQGHHYKNPVWSPDGTQVAFESDLSDQNIGIYLMRLDGIGVPVNLTSALDLENDYLKPTWSPDGNRIAFTSENGRNSEIWIIDVESRSPLYRPAVDGNKYREPDWSPDGHKIAFSSKEGRNDSNIYSMPAEGSTEVDPLTRDQDGVVSKKPTWSPDGTKIAFQSNPDPDNEKSNIYVMPAGGSSNPTSLTKDKDNSYQDPEWSPDGTKIALSARRNEDTDADIYIMNSDGSALQLALKKPGSAESAPSWQRVIVPDEDDSDTGPGTPPGSSPGAPPLTGPVSIESVLFKLTSPKLKRSKAKRVKRAALYRYIKRGFKGKVSGYMSVRASLVRVVERRVKAKSKRKTKRKAKRVKRCYSLSRKRTSCGKTSRKGISIKTAGTSSTFKYLPTAKSKRQLKRLKKGKRIRRGLYQLTFKAKPKAGGKSKTFRYRLKVR